MKVLAPLLACIFMFPNHLAAQLVQYQRQELVSPISQDARLALNALEKARHMSLCLLSFESDPDSAEVVGPFIERSIDEFAEFARAATGEDAGALQKHSPREFQVAIRSPSKTLAIGAIWSSFSSIQAGQLEQFEDVLREYERLFRDHFSFRFPEQGELFDCERAFSGIQPND